MKLIPLTRSWPVRRLRPGAAARTESDVLAIEDSATRQEKASQPEMLLSAKVLQIQEYDDALTARIIEKITVRSRNEIEIRFIGGYKKTMQLI